MVTSSPTSSYGPAGCTLESSPGQLVTNIQLWLAGHQHIALIGWPPSETRKLNFIPILTFQAIFTHKYKSNL
jgi:hypothetical protein